MPIVHKVKYIIMSSILNIVTCSLPDMGFGLIIGFMECLYLVTTMNCSSLTDLHVMAHCIQWEYARIV
jgi:hypothetical protein